MAKQEIMVTIRCDHGPVTTYATVGGHIPRQGDYLELEEGAHDDDSTLSLFQKYYVREVVWSGGNYKEEDEFTYVVLNCVFVGSRSGQLP